MYMCADEIFLFETIHLAVTIGPSQPVHSLPHNDAFTVSHTRWFAWIRIFVPLHRPLPWSWQPCRVQLLATMEDVSRSLNRCDLKSLSNNIKYSCCVSLKHSLVMLKLAVVESLVVAIIKYSCCGLAWRFPYAKYARDAVQTELMMRHGGSFRSIVSVGVSLSLPIQFGLFSSAGFILAQPCRCWNIATVCKWDYVM